MLFTYQHNGQTHTVNLEARLDGSYTITIGDRSYICHVQALKAGSWRLTLGEQAITVHTAVLAGARFVHLDGQDYTLTLPDERGEQRRGGAGGGDLTAQMPGQVVNVLVAAGEAVTRGQTLIILEAMKMEIRVAAPGDGQVKRLLVQPGQVVERGQRLLEIE
jgi:biotin carboxyl carrier protein